jgi:hypothetical protein
MIKKLLPGDLVIIDSRSTALTDLRCTALVIHVTTEVSNTHFMRDTIYCYGLDGHKVVFSQHPGTYVPSSKNPDLRPVRPNKSEICKFFVENLATFYKTTHCDNA